MTEAATVTGHEPAEIRVLLVDDDPLTLQLHRAHLARVGGFAVEGECRSAREAASAMTAPEQRIDLVLLDVTMPDGTGLDVLRLARARGARADVIAVSGVRDADVVREMVALGAVHYLIKPYSFSVFRERIEGYREFHLRSLRSDGPATQYEVDALFAALRPPAEAPLPKGLARGTLELVSAVVRNTGPCTSSEIAERLRISREVSRRYLEYLADGERVERLPRYGARGRPQIEYRWNAGAAR